MSIATMARHGRPHDRQPQSEAVEAERLDIDPLDESWRPFPYYGERPDDRPTLTGLIMSKLRSAVGRTART